MGGTADSGAVRGLWWEIEDVGFVEREVEEGAAREHEPWELRRQVERGFGNGVSPAPANGTESEVVRVDG